MPRSIKYRKRERKGGEAMAAEKGVPREYLGSLTKLCTRLWIICGREMILDAVCSRFLGNIVGSGPRGA